MQSMNHATETAANLPELSSVKKTAAWMGVSIRTVQNLVYSKQLTHMRVGRRILIPASSVFEYVKKHTIQSVG